MDFPYLVGYAGIEENALGSRRFARVHMGYDAYIAIAVNRRSAGHMTYCCFEWGSRLVAVMSKSLVGFGHTVGVFALLDSTATSVSSVHEFTGQTGGHRLFAP